MRPRHPAMQAHRRPLIPRTRDRLVATRRGPALSRRPARVLRARHWPSPACGKFTCGTPSPTALGVAAATGRNGTDAAYASKQYYRHARPPNRRLWSSDDHDLRLDARRTVSLLKSFLDDEFDRLTLRLLLPPESSSEVRLVGRHRTTIRRRCPAPRRTHLSSSLCPRGVPWVPACGRPRAACSCHPRARSTPARRA